MIRSMRVSTFDSSSSGYYFSTEKRLKLDDDEINYRVSVLCTSVRLKKRNKENNNKKSVMNISLLYSGVSLFFSSLNNN